MLKWAFIILLFSAGNIGAVTELEVFDQLCDGGLCKTKSYHLLPSGVRFFAGAETPFDVMEATRPGNLKHDMDRLFTAHNTFAPNKRKLLIVIIDDVTQCQAVETEFDALVADGQYPMHVCLATAPVSCGFGQR